MKKVLIFLLTYSLLLNGCMSYFTIFEKEGEQNFPVRDIPIKITLLDGAIIESKTNQHIYLPESTDIVLYQSELRYLKNDYTVNTKSWLLPAELDSIKIFNAEAMNPKMSKSEEFECILYDTILYKETSATGFWVSGQSIKNGDENDFIGEVKLNEIEKIERYDISPTKIWGGMLVTFLVISWIVFWTTGNLVWFP